MKANFNFFAAVSLALSLLAAACGPAAVPVSAASPLKVLSVETFLADVAQNVAGERARVESLAPLGMDPHAFEPTAQDVRKIAESQVLILNGAGFEAWAAKTLENAGGERLVIEASAGLSSRQAREGEVAEMSAAEQEDAICAQASAEQAQALTAGSAPSAAAELPIEAGLFSVSLAAQPDGSFAGYLQYTANEAGDFQIALGSGMLTAQNSSTGAELSSEKSLSLGCAPFTQGHIIGLEKNGQYILALTGFDSSQTRLLIGPAGGPSHQEGDPHFWLDPLKVIKYVENIRDGLIAADPDGKETYTQNAAAYIAQLQELDTWIETQVQQIPPQRRLIVTNHESFGYFADRYGFKIIGTIVPSVSTNASPSAQQLARLVDRIKASGATVIFLETGSSPQLAAQVAAETGVKVIDDLYTHSITPANGKAPTYIAIMKYNVNTIVAALK